MKLITRKELFEMKGRVLGHQVNKHEAGDGYDLGELMMMADFRRDTNDMSTMVVHPQYMLQFDEATPTMPQHVLEDLVALKGKSLEVDFGYWGREGMFNDQDTLYLVYEKSDIQDFVAFLLSSTLE